MRRYYHPQQSRRALRLKSYYFQFQLPPSLGENAFYTGIFSIYLIVNVFFNIRYKTYDFMATMCFSLAGDIIEYSERIML